MSISKIIDRNFIKNCIHDDRANPDEDEYNSILRKIQNQDLQIDKDTFEKPYDWKAQRSKIYLDLDHFELYKSSFREIPELND